MTDSAKQDDVQFAISSAADQFFFSQQRPDRLAANFAKQQLNTFLLLRLL